MVGRTSAKRDETKRGANANASRAWGSVSAPLRGVGYRAVALRCEPGRRLLSWGNECPSGDHDSRLATRHRDRDGRAGGATKIRRRAILRPMHLLQCREPPQSIVATGFGAGEMDRAVGLRWRRCTADAPFPCIKRERW